MKTKPEKITITSTATTYIVTLHRASSQGGGKERIGTFESLAEARAAKAETEKERNS